MRKRAVVLDHPMRRNTHAIVRTAVAAVIATACLVGIAGSASAALPTGRILASPCLNFHNDAKIAAPLVGCIPYNTTISIDCTKQGDAVTGPYGTETIWDHTSYGGHSGYVADAWVYTGQNGAVAGTCPTGGYPYPRGATLSYNPGYSGQCTWGAEYEWYSHFGVYANTLSSNNNGNAQYWASNAAAHGWTVKSYPATPVANGTLAVFQPGVDGALAGGHVAWVTAVYSNGTFQIYEMNGTAGLGKWDYRTVSNMSGVSFIYW